MHALLLEDMDEDLICPKRFNHDGNGVGLVKICCLETMNIFFTFDQLRIKRGWFGLWLALTSVSSRGLGKRTCDHHDMMG